MILFNLSNPGAFNARVLADGTIQFSQIWAEMRTTGDRISVALHEHHHWKNDLTVARDAKGDFISIVIEIPKYSQDQIQKMTDECLTLAIELGIQPIDLFVSNCIGDVHVNWTYLPLKLLSK